MYTFLFFSLSSIHQGVPGDASSVFIWNIVSRILFITYFSFIGTDFYIWLIAYSLFVSVTLVQVTEIVSASSWSLRSF